MNHSDTGVFSPGGLQAPFHYPSRNSPPNAGTAASPYPQQQQQQSSGPITAYEYTLIVESVKFITIPGMDGGKESSSLFASPPSRSGSVNTAAALNPKVVFRWYYSDECRGSTAETPVVGDEAAFLYKVTFVVATVGNSIPHLMQISVVHLGTENAPTASSGMVVPRSNGEKPAAPAPLQSILGVLMLDLNAHIPKAPSKQSRQRATLAMSRCVGPRPLMIKLMIECAPASPTSQAALQLAGMSASPSLPRAMPMATSGPAGGVNSPPPAYQQQQQQSFQLQQQSTNRISDDDLLKLRALVSTLSAANDQLSDENAALRRQLQAAKVEPSYTYSAGGKAGSGGSDPEDLSAYFSMTNKQFKSQDYMKAQEQLRDELNAVKAEGAVLHKGLQSAKDQLRASLQREEELQKDVAALTKKLQIATQEVSRMELDQHALVSLSPSSYAAAIGASPHNDRSGHASARRSNSILPSTGANGSNAAGTAAASGGPSTPGANAGSWQEVQALRDMLTSSQQMNRDLRAMLVSSEAMAESLRKEVKAAQKDLKDEKQLLMDNTTKQDQRCVELESQLRKAEASLRVGQREMTKMHQYGEEVHQVCVQLQQQVEAERREVIKLRRKLSDIGAVQESLELAQISERMLVGPLGSAFGGRTTSNGDTGSQQQHQQRQQPLFSAVHSQEGRRSPSVGNQQRVMLSATHSALGSEIHAAGGVPAVSAWNRLESNNTDDQLSGISSVVGSRVTSTPGTARETSPVNNGVPSLVTPILKSGCVVDAPVYAAVVAAPQATRRAAPVGTTSKLAASTPKPMFKR